MVSLLLVARSNCGASASMINLAPLALKILISAAFVLEPVAISNPSANALSLFMTFSKLLEPTHCQLMMAAGKGEGGKWLNRAISDTSHKITFAPHRVSGAEPAPVGSGRSVCQDC